MEAWLFVLADFADVNNITHLLAYAFSNFQTFRGERT